VDKGVVVVSASPGTQHLQSHVGSSIPLLFRIVLVFPCMDRSSSFSDPFFIMWISTRKSRYAVFDQCPGDGSSLGMRSHIANHACIRQIKRVWRRELINRLVRYPRIVVRREEERPGPSRVVRIHGMMSWITGN
jgi:hypothetical protein